MSKIKVHAVQFDGFANNSKEIMEKLGAVISVERRPFGDAFLISINGEAPQKLRDTDWIIKTNYGFDVVMDAHFRAKFEAIPFVAVKEKKVNNQIENNFSYHAPKEGQPQKYEMIRDSAKNLANIFDSSAPDSREKSLAMTKLEEAVFWINASIARNE